MLKPQKNSKSPKARAKSQEVDDSKQKPSPKRRAITDSKNEVPVDLLGIARKLLYGVEIKDRSWRFTSYPQCFVGSEAVAFLYRDGIAKSTRHAEEIGNILMSVNIIRHVTKG